MEDFMTPINDYFDYVLEDDDTVLDDDNLCGGVAYPGEQSWNSF